MQSTPAIVHLPVEIAGQVGLICEFLRKAGFNCFAFNFFETVFNFNKIFHTDVYELMRLFEHFLDYFTVFHYHNGCTLMDDMRDVLMIKEKHKILIMHHRGTDVRFRSLAKKGPGYENPYVYAENSLDDREIEKNLSFFSHAMDAAIVQDYELYHYVIEYYRQWGKPVFVLPRLVNTGEYRPSPPPKDNRHPLVVHAPTHRQFKGTQHIEEAISQLQKEASFSYVELNGKSHREVQALFYKADIIIDQVLCGTYGNVSVEAMAFGKPVICYIRPDLAKTYPADLPIISANPDNLFYELRRLVLDPELRHDTGKKGRHYVEKYHDAAFVIRQLLDIYNTLLKKTGT